jgi:cytochrome b involved in lipid metabolism
MSNKNNKTYTYEEISKHNTQSDLWVIYKDEVFDITKFNNHPGGPEVILEIAGGDITTSFLDIGHSEAAVALMKEYFLGKVDKKSKPVLITPVSQQSDYSGLILPLVIIVLAILAYYFL